MRDCYLEAPRLDPNNSYAWNSKCTYAWFNPGATMTAGERVAVNGTDRTQRDCYLEALRLDPNNSIAFRNLGVAMPAGERVASS